MKPTTASTADAVVPTGGRMGHREDRRDPRRRAESRSVTGETSRGAVAGTSTAGAWTLEVAARDYIWLYDFRHGVGLSEIAAREGVTVRQVREGLERARALDRNRSKDNPIESLKSSRLDDIGFRLMPLFPIMALTPQSACPHHDSIERGSRLCCMVCHASGMDDHPGLRRDPLIDPSPEPAPAPAAVSSKPGKSRENRKQRRRRQLAGAAVA